MAFLDNSGDIILDAVLTETGRRKMAAGTFKITKFALADDEINYGSFNANHASGSAYYDLEVLQTPVLEAFTNNTATMKSKLISLSNTNILYLPVMKMNEKTTAYKPSSNTSLGSGSFVILVDQDSVDEWDLDVWGDGIIDGTDPSSKAAATIRVDQGLHTTELPATVALETSLTETQYIVEMDNRLGTLTNFKGEVQAESYVDDDQIATYFISQGDGSTMVYSSQQDGANDVKKDESIPGPRGTNFQCRLKASNQLNSSTFLFEQVGSSITGPTGLVSAATDQYYFIDTTLRITGATTGYRIDIPIRYLKKQ